MGGMKCWLVELDWFVDQQMDIPTEHLTNWPTDQLMDDRPTNWPFDWPTDGSTNRLISWQMDGPTDQLMDGPSVQQTDQPIDRSTDWTTQPVDWLTTDDAQTDSLTNQMTDWLVISLCLCYIRLSLGHIGLEPSRPASAVQVLRGWSGSITDV